MGIISQEKVNNLYWLGRYSERVYTTIREFFDGYDKMLEDPFYYKIYCESMQIPNIYQDEPDFIVHYIGDENDVNSILSNLYRAYDNCIVLRNEIGSETMSYLELALKSLKEIHDFDSYVLDLQNVLDYLLAFYGSLSENVEDYEVRSIITTGKRIERLDLYLRLQKETPVIIQSYTMLDNRLRKNPLLYDKMAMLQLSDMLSQETIPYMEAVQLVERLVD